MENFEEKEAELIRLFTQSRPYVLGYAKVGFRRDAWLTDLPIIDVLITKGLVRILRNSDRAVVYEFIHPFRITSQD